MLSIKLFIVRDELGIESTEENNPIEVKDALKMTLHHYTKDIINLKHCVKVNLSNIP